MSSTSVGRGIEYGTDVAWQAFFDALRQAVTSTASLQSRLATLVIGVCALRQDNFTNADTWWRFEEFLKATAGVPKKATAAKVLATCSKMSGAEAGKWLEEAVHILSDLSEESDL